MPSQHVGVLQPIGPQAVLSCHTSLPAGSCRAHRSALAAAAGNAGVCYGTCNADSLTAHVRGGVWEAQNSGPYRSSSARQDPCHAPGHALTLLGIRYARSACRSICCRVRWISSNCLCAFVCCSNGRSARCSSVTCRCMSARPVKSRSPESLGLLGVTSLVPFDTSTRLKGRGHRRLCAGNSGGMRQVKLLKVNGHKESSLCTR